MNHWIDESMSQWISESRNHRMNEPRNQWINEFCKPRPPKVLRSCQISGDLNANQNLAIQSRAVRCTFCRPFAQIEAREPRKQRPYFGDPRSHITRQNNGLRARERFTHEFTRFRTLTLPNYLMMSGWHDDVRDMMAWLLTMTIVRNSEVF